MSDSRRSTPFTARAGPNSRPRPVASIVRSSASASSRRLVSVPVPMLKTASVAPLSAASRLARAMSSV
jgi:hypothetical protein